MSTLATHLRRLELLQVLASRLRELDTSPDGNNRRAYTYNQRRRELLPFSGDAPIWWSATYAGNSYLLPPGQPAPTLYLHR